MYIIYFLCRINWISELLKLKVNQSSFACVSSMRNWKESALERLEYRKPENQLVWQLKRHCRTLCDIKGSATFDRLTTAIFTHHASLRSACVVRNFSWPNLYFFAISRRDHFRALARAVNSWMDSAFRWSKIKIQIFLERRWRDWHFECQHKLGRWECLYPTFLVCRLLRKSLRIKS